MALIDYAYEAGPTLIIVIGFILFVIPEPATSALGVGLMLLGAAYWFYDWNRVESYE